MPVCHVALCAALQPQRRARAANRSDTAPGAVKGRLARIARATLRAGVPHGLKSSFPGHVDGIHWDQVHRGECQKATAVVSAARDARATATPKTATSSTAAATAPSSSAASESTKTSSRAEPPVDKLPSRAVPLANAEGHATSHNYRKEVEDAVRRDYEQGRDTPTAVHVRSCQWSAV
eukprot:scaffold744_cov370-Prasinococcus_capsulatus_cf.AAC.12